MRHRLARQGIPNYRVVDYSDLTQNGAIFLLAMIHKDEEPQRREPFEDMLNCFQRFPCTRCLRSAEGLADAFFGTGWGRVTVEIGPVVTGT